MAATVRASIPLLTAAPPVTSPGTGSASATDDKPKLFLGLSGTQTIGSALAAVTSALVGSFLGVAGTLIGAALGSVVATVGAPLYARTLRSAATVALTKIPQRRWRGLPADDGDVPADRTTLGKALSGNPAAGETDKSTEEVKEVSAQVEEGPNEVDGPATDSNPSGGDGGSAGTEAPGADEAGATPPVDTAPETRTEPEAFPGNRKTSEPEVFSDPGSAEQPGP